MRVPAQADCRFRREPITEVGAERRIVIELGRKRLAEFRDGLARHIIAEDRPRDLQLRPITPIKVEAARVHPLRTKPRVVRLLADPEVRRERADRSSCCN